MVCWYRLREGDEMDYSEGIVRWMLGYEVLCQVREIRALRRDTGGQLFR